ncbi:hypothetical protein F5Y05DRAFT_416068 [Hypoxylon sp. FL0543]|nr:hypothetical protein F5Y05DRAFT_416068 [Hypoxylon sp. FL0543]
MADPLGAAGSIVGIAAFGLQFATTLQTYIEAVADARESLRDIAFDVSATASALEQLHEFTKINEDGKAIANDAGVQQVVRLANQCKQVYTAIIDLLAKAAGVPRDGNGELSLDALDLDGLNATTLMQKLIWPFKEPRIKKHQEELRWLKISLLFHLRLMELAKTKMMAPTRSLNSWEKEVALQATLEKLLSRKEEYAREIAAERRRSKKRLRKRVKGSRTSSISTEEETRARDPSLEQTTSASKPRHGVVAGEGLFRPKEVNGIAEVKDPSRSEGPIGDLLTQVGPSRRPKPPKTRLSLNNNDPIPNPIIIDTPSAAIEPSNAPATEDTGKQESGAGHSVSSEPVLGHGFHMLSHISPMPSGTPFNIQSSPADVDNNKQTGQSNANDKDNIPHSQLPATSASTGPINENGNTQNQLGAQFNSSSNDNNNDNGGVSVQGHVIADLNDRYKPTHSRGTFRSLPRLSRLFSKRDRVVRDWESQELEAYLIESESDSAITFTSVNGNGNAVRKLPFGHQELASTLRKIKRSRKGDLWTQYTSLTPAQRVSVDHAVLEAHRTTPHTRMCVAITTVPPSQPNHHNPCIVIFFALGPPVLPITFRYYARYYQFAFELCRAWEGMQDMVKRALPDVPDVDFGIQRGQYHLKTFDNHTILPATWSNVVRPGLMVSLVLGPLASAEFPPPRPPASIAPAEFPPANLFGPTGPIARHPAFRPPQPRSTFVSGAWPPQSPSPPPPRKKKGKKPARPSSRMRECIIGSDSDIAPQSDTDSDVSSSNFTETTEDSALCFGGVPRSRGYSARASERRSEMRKKTVAAAETWDLEPEDAEADGVVVGEDEGDIIDFEAEQEIAKLGLGGLLGKWTNAFDAPAEDEQHEK